MDYTTLARVKRVLKAESDTDDDLIAEKVTAASREIDRRSTGVTGFSAHDYFTQADVTNEVLQGLVAMDGRILCYPHKAAVNSVSAFAYRPNPKASWISVDPSIVTFDVGPTVTAWINANWLRGRLLQVQISYNGGLATTTDSLPADLAEIATVLAIRFYKEGETGLSDMIGVAEEGTQTYTKALPLRVKDALKPYKRVMPW